VRLQIDDEELATCVSCGLCLPHCPTFRATGEEALSPRGRITAMRAVHLDGSPVDAEFVHFMETCVQCRGCEPACPSGVPFGRLMEGTRTTLAADRAITPRWQRLAYRILPRHRLLLAGSTVLAVAQRVHMVPRRLGLSGLPLKRGRRVRRTGDDVWLFTGCVMDAWMRDTHRNTAKVLAALGFGVRPTGGGADCCGALHSHAGLHDQAVTLAERVIAALPGDAPIVVNSAGCGAALKEYGHLVGTPQADAFAARVVDINQFVADRIESLPPAIRRHGPVIVQDPCHLRHVQRAHLSVRAVVGHCADVVELADDGLCCGAGGAYSAQQPELAGTVRDRKLAAIDSARQQHPAGSARASVVATANPGCAMHLAAAGCVTRHPIDLLAEVLP
jgi:glycolate oxidase iron-sulfur subunit